MVGISHGIAELIALIIDNISLLKTIAITMMSSVTEYLISIVQNMKVLTLLLSNHVITSSVMSSVLPSTFFGACVTIMGIAIFYRVYFGGD